MTCRLRSGAVISYTVFEPDDASGVSYRWYGQSTVYLLRDNREFDAFELAGVSDPAGVESAVAAYHDQHHFQPHPPQPEPGPLGDPL